MRFGYNTNVDDVLHAINNAQMLLGERGRLTVRSVVVRVGGNWYNHATLVRLSLDSKSDSEIVRFGDVVLVTEQIVLERELSRDELQDVIMSWRRAVGAPSGPGLQERCSAQRYFSDPRVPRWPYWEFRLNERIGEGVPTPDVGSFLDVDREIFAPDLPGLTALWLKRSDWQNIGGNIALDYRFIIEDHRGRFGDLRRSENGLSIGVEELPGQSLYCSAVIEELGGATRQLVRPVREHRAEFALDLAVQTLRLWLMLRDGTPLDQYAETPQQSSWGPAFAIYHRAPAADPALIELMQALAGGETLNVEFKPYVRLKDRDEKALELLETICAFANASGGVLLVGVDKHGAPTGVDRDLIRPYNAQCQGDAECLRSAYTADFRRFVNEGLTPHLSITFEWRQIALASILLVRVATSDRLASLIPNGEIFKRVGATNRRFRPGDVILDASAYVEGS